VKSAIGNKIVEIGDWVIKRKDGEMFSMADQNFKDVYEEGSNDEEFTDEP